MRKFILIAASLLALVGCKQTPEKEIGIQLYSVRSLIGSAEKYAENHDNVFSKLQEYGYKTVELCWYGDGKFLGRTPEELKADLAQYGLTAISTHTMKNLSAEAYQTRDFSAELEWWKKCIADHKAVGCKYIVAPSFSVPSTLDDLKFCCEYFNAIGKLCAEQGMKFGYHNHSHEFNTVEDQIVYDFMLENTDPQYVFFEMDVYWTMMAKKSPVIYFNKYPGRFELLHIKDWAEVGQSGMVGFDAIFNAAETAGLKHFVVEMERTEVGDILETCRISSDYLKNADFVKKSYAE